MLIQVSITHVTSTPNSHKEETARSCKIFLRENPKEKDEEEGPAETSLVSSNSPDSSVQFRRQLYIYTHSLNSCLSDETYNVLHFHQYFLH